jgi:hypothetical protein
LNHALKLKKVQVGAGSQFSPSLRLWWQPSRVSLHNGQGWKTFLHPYYTTKMKAEGPKTLGVSPVDTTGSVRFVAWDVDTGDPDHVKSILDALPSGINPLVSFSGKKGWHIWVFPDKPLPLSAAMAFSRAIRQKAGVTCEIYPTSEMSRCLKWPDQKHPDTGLVETFVPLNNLNDHVSLDTAIILELLQCGFYRTPHTKIEQWLHENGEELIRSAAGAVTAAIEKFSEPSLEETHWFLTCSPPPDQGKLILHNRTNMAAIPEIALGLAEIAGIKVKRIGAAFRCILPSHEEKHPSAAFCFTGDGRILYHDFHQRSGSEWYTLGEVYHAIFTGKTVKLRAVDSARWLARLALRLGYKNRLAADTEKILFYIDCLIKDLSLNREVLIFPVGCTALNKTPVLDKIWPVIKDEAMISAMAGFEEIKLSKRWLSKRADVPGEVANRAANLLCVLGILEKVPGSGGYKGDRFKLKTPGNSEVLQRWEALGKPALREFKANLVTEILGQDVTAAVFRRGT